jgi:hypothetical protein
MVSERALFSTAHLWFNRKFASCKQNFVHEGGDIKLGQGGSHQSQNKASKVKLYDILCEKSAVILRTNLKLGNYTMEMM